VSGKNRGADCGKNSVENTRKLKVALAGSVDITDVGLPHFPPPIKRPTSIQPHIQQENSHVRFLTGFFSPVHQLLLGFFVLLQDAASLARMLSAIVIGHEFNQILVLGDRIRAATACSGVDRGICCTLALEWKWRRLNTTRSLGKQNSHTKILQFHVVKC